MADGSVVTARNSRAGTLISVLTYDNPSMAYGVETMGRAPEWLIWAL